MINPKRMIKKYLQLCFIAVDDSPFQSVQTICADPPASVNRFVDESVRNVNVIRNEV
jgi:hypothetical protein